jgi:hypothetical protein
MDSDLGFMSFLTPPAFFYSKNTTTVIDGVKAVEFDNGTIITTYPPPPKDESAYKRATAEKIVRSEADGSVEI